MDLILEVEALSSIDYPKMLQMQVRLPKLRFSNTSPATPTTSTPRKTSSKNCLGSFAKASNDYDTYTENTYTTMLMRNMKSRLSATLRENLELRTCKAIYEKSQEISEESEEYLRKVIEEVLENHCEKKRTKDFLVGLHSTGNQPNLLQTN
jgi:hypothetical protein